MKSAFASLVLLAATVAAQTITLNTPSGATGAIQCEIFQITWSGGTPPFDLRLNDPSNNFVEEIGSGIQSSPFPWTVNQPSGQEFAMVIIDSAGNTGLSGQFIIQPSTNTGCLNGGSASGSGSAAPASTAGGSAGSAPASTAGGSVTAPGPVSTAASGPTTRPAGSSGASRPTGSSTGTAPASSQSGTRGNSSGALVNTASTGLLGALLAAAAALF